MSRLWERRFNPVGRSLRRIARERARVVPSDGRCAGRRTQSLDEQRAGERFAPLTVHHGPTRAAPT